MSDCLIREFIMSFTSLPREIIVLIIKQLDVKSILNLYNTCQYFRNIVCMQGVIKECHLSLNTLATAQSLKLNFIKNISRHLQELNMSGVHDLCKSSLLPAMKRLKSLKTLNIAYTKINISEFVELYQACPTIKNITINFHFAAHAIAKSLDLRHMYQCQLVFQFMENVHFVGSFANLLVNKSALLILGLAKLNSLTYTIAERNCTTCYRCDLHNGIDFKEFIVYILQWKETVIIGGNIYKLLHINDYEYVIIHVILQDTYDVYCSKSFKQFFTNYGIYTTSDDGLQCYDGNAIIMIWNKKTKFDDLFFSNLLKKMQQYFPCNYVPPDKEEIVFRSTNDYFSIVASDDEDENLNPIPGPEFKRRRVGTRNFTVDYDEIMKEKREVQLKLRYCNFNRPITLSPSSNYLKKLTLLTITGPVRYSREFFNVLFRHCDNLVTLSIENLGVSQCTLLISKFIHLSKCLKNFRIVDKNMNTKILFTALSKCKTLENIHVQDVHYEFTHLADPTAIFKNCFNMYYFCMYVVSMTEAAKARNSRILKNAKLASGKGHLYVEMVEYQSENVYNYDPYIDVFKLSSIEVKPTGKGK